MFTSGACHLDWVAAQYGMTGPAPDPGCSETRGDVDDKDRTTCLADTGLYCDFASGFLIENYFPSELTNNADDPRNLRFNRCELRTVEGYSQMVFQCPTNATHVGVCPNNCVGVDSSAIIAGGPALFLATGFVVQSLVGAAGVAGLGMAGLGAAVAMGTCSWPLCQVGDRCCLLAYAGVNRGYVCPEVC